MTRGQGERWGQAVMCDNKDWDGSNLCGDGWGGDRAERGRMGMDSKYAGTDGDELSPLPPPAAL